MGSGGFFPRKFYIINIKIKKHVFITKLTIFCYIYTFLLFMVFTELLCATGMVETSEHWGLTDLSSDYEVMPP